jgi:hypothetical protein
MSKPVPAFDDAATDKKRGAPTMSRSRGQLAASYAPGAFFTFEGGLGACIAQPDYQAGVNVANITPTVKSQIVMRFEDAVKSWYETAINCRINDTAKPPVLPAQCVSQALINSSYTGLRNIDSAHFVFVSPDAMGYAPAPLTFVCNHCGLYRGFESVADFAERKSAALKVKCTKIAGDCHWRQLDVIFVHWSGRWEPVRPGRWNWDSVNDKIQEPFDRCQQCGQQEFRLETRHSVAAIGGWHFVCTSCGAADFNGWHKHDPETLEIVKSDFLKLIAVARMEPVSYRASAAFYPQSDQFILFAQQQHGLLSLLDPSRQSELKNFLAEHFGYGRSRPTMAEIEIILKQSEKGSAALDKYTAKKAMLESLPKEAGEKLFTMLKDDLKDMSEAWFTDGLVKETNLLPAPLVAAVDTRKSDYDARYDPFRLVVEHQALVENHLDAPREASGRSPFVHFDRLDKDLAPKDSAQQAQQEIDTRAAFGRLGIDTMGLIRNFKLCRFTYGYTRVSAVPVVEKHHINMPVRLNLFPPVKMEQGAARTPIYVITQENEAFYVRLDPEMVYRWLSTLGLDDAFPWTKASGTSLGAMLLERAQPMQRFLTNVHREQRPFAYYYTYTLLHTYAHVMMRAIAELSGLDAGSLGEYLFPADLTFVVYRSGTTLDLGNLSSLWRNANARFLHHLGEPTTLSCNSGSLCLQRGGACPDCILIPETSCIAQNQLLSRSVLRGGPRPREDMGEDRIAGYLDVVNAPVAA